MSKHGQDYNEQFTSKEMFEQGRQYEREHEREETARLNKRNMEMFYKSTIVHIVANVATIIAGIIIIYLIAQI